MYKLKYQLNIPSWTKNATNVADNKKLRFYLLMQAKMIKIIIK